MLKWGGIYKALEEDKGMEEVKALEGGVVEVLEVVPVVTVYAQSVGTRHHINRECHVIT